MGKLLILLVGLLLVACLHFALEKQTRNDSPPTPHHTALTTQQLQVKQAGVYVGVANCIGCHSEKSPSKFDKDFVLLTEYDTWLEKDKHSHAFEVLSKALAKKMGTILGYEPVKKDACLNCHALNGPQDRQGSHFRLQDGLSCEACHGPATKWLGEHQENSRRLKSGQEKNT